MKKYRSLQRFWREAVEWWPEEMLLEKIFYGRRRFLHPKWWAMKCASLFFPKPKIEDDTDP